MLCNSNNKRQRTTKNRVVLFHPCLFEYFLDNIWGIHKLNKINISIYYLSVYIQAIYPNEFEIVQEISQTTYTIFIHIHIHTIFQLTIFIEVISKLLGC